MDRLPLTIETLKASKLGKLVVKLSKNPPSPGESRLLICARSCALRSNNKPFGAILVVANGVAHYLTHDFNIHNSNFSLFFCTLAAIKDMAFNLERKWRGLLESSNGKEEGESRQLNLLNGRLNSTFVMFCRAQVEEAESGGSAIHETRLEFCIREEGGSSCEGAHGDDEEGGSAGKGRQVRFVLLLGEETEEVTQVHEGACGEEGGHECRASFVD